MASVYRVEDPLVPPAIPVEALGEPVEGNALKGILLGLLISLVFWIALALYLF